MSSAAVPSFLTIGEVARILRSKVWPTYKLVTSGQLRAIKPAGVYLITRADLAAFIEEQRTA